MSHAFTTPEPAPPRSPEPAPPRGPASLAFPTPLGVVVGLALLVLGSVAFGALLDGVLENDDLTTVDHPVLEWLVAHRTAWLTAALTGVTNAFGPTLLPIIVAVGCGLWWWRTRRWRDPALLVGAMLLAVGVSSVVKAIVGRPRPDETSMTVPGVESTFSFPSGHTIGAATLVLVLGYLVWSRRGGAGALVAWVVASAALVALVGGSRLYLGYHFTTDVLAGAALAVAVLGVVVLVDVGLPALAERRAAAGRSPGKIEGPP